MTVRRKLARRFLVSAVTLVVGVMTLATTAMAQGNANPGVLPVNSKPFGKSYAEWSAAWWQWALAIDADENPLLDPDGRFASTGQGRKVWFLAGTILPVEEGDPAIVRRVTIPTGTAIFFPILNKVYLNFSPDLYPENFDPPLSDPVAEKKARDAIAVVLDLDKSRVVIDGKVVKNLDRYRVQSPIFPSVLPDENIIDVVNEFYGSDFDILGGLYPESVSDGYWIMLPPLSKGEHTIRIEGTDSFGFVTKVTYLVTVR